MFGHSFVRSIIILFFSPLAFAECSMPLVLPPIVVPNNWQEYCAQYEAAHPDSRPVPETSSLGIDLSSAQPDVCSALFQSSVAKCEGEPICLSGAATTFEICLTLIANQASDTTAGSASAKSPVPKPAPCCCGLIPQPGCTPFDQIGPDGRLCGACA